MTGTWGQTTSSLKRGVVHFDSRLYQLQNHPTDFLSFFFKTYQRFKTMYINENIIWNLKTFLKEQTHLKNQFQLNNDYFSISNIQMNKYQDDQSLLAWNLIIESLLILYSVRDFLSLFLIINYCFQQQIPFLQVHGVLNMVSILFLKKK